MADSSLINIGLSGVRAHQAALSTTGQNITNANTEGYTRQRVNLEAQVSAGTGIGVQGVRVEGIERIYDEAAVRQLRLDTSVSGRLGTMSQQIEQIDSLLADEASSLNRGFEAFFAAMQSAANSPSSLPARELVLAESQGLVTRFQSLDGRLREQQAAVNRQIGSEVETINQLAASIAELNARLGPMTGSDGNTNALLDQRDELLRELAGHVDIRTVPEGELGMNVFVGKGHPLVVGNNVQRLGVSADGDLQVRNRDGSALVGVGVNGGSLAGLLDFRDQTLQPVIDELGRLALAFAGTINQTHAQGVNLRGEYGGNLFADLNSAAAMSARVSPANRAGNDTTADLAVRIDDPAALVASDYRVSFLGAGGETFEVRRDSDGAVLARGAVGDARPVLVSFDGLALEIGPGQIGPGAEFRISAAGNGVGDLAVAIGDPRDLALASPLAVQAGNGNTGTGSISLAGATDVDAPLYGADGELVPPLLVRFTSPNSYEVLDNSDPTSPRPLEPPLWGLPFVPGGQQPLLPDGDLQLLVSDGLDGNALSDSVAQTATLDPVANGFAAETISVYRADPALGSRSLQETVAITPGMSARAIAAALEQVDGVSAAARTQVEISGLRDNGLGQPLTVAVNGESLSLPAGASLGDLADAISANGALSQAGIRAVSDGETLTLTALRGDDLSIHVAGDVSEGLTLTDQTGRSVTLDGSGPGGGYETVTVGGSVRLLMDGDVRLESDSVSPGGGLFSDEPQGVPAGLGLQATLSGRPQAGDVFAIDFNGAGNLDNHNALAMAALQIDPSVGDPPANFSETYTSIVEKVGIRTAQLRADTQAAEALLAQSVARRESVSGVNLDEEAANLIRFEQGYNASARVMQVAREIFDVLLGAVG